MSQIAQLTDNSDPFSAIADSYLTQWQTYAINSDATPPHTTLSYGDANSHGTPPFRFFLSTADLPNSY